MITRKIDVVAINEVRINNDACKGLPPWKCQPLIDTNSFPVFSQLSSIGAQR